MISIATRVQQSDAATIAHIPKFTGTIWYVDGTNGDDLHAGTEPGTARATIASALLSALAGDAITVRSGTYTENVELALDGLELWCELGTLLDGILTVSGNTCRVTGLTASGAGGNAFDITGSGCVLEDCSAAGGVIGFNVTGSLTTLCHGFASGYTATGFDVSVGQVHFELCIAQGNLTATRGFYLSTNAADAGFYRDCQTIANVTAGFETVAGADVNLFTDCSSGGSEGFRIDAGANNMWARFVDRMRREGHEHVYPPPSGEGVASVPVTIDNSVTDDSGAGPWDDQDYWGDVVRVIPPTTLTGPWWSLGLYIHATTAADDQQWQVFFTNYRVATTRNAGNAWSYQETVLTVADGTVVAVGDKVWITGTGALDGEICDVADVTGNVVTITSETRFSADTGLKYNYGGAETMYVIYRAADRALHGYQGDFSASGARVFKRFNWAQQKLIEPNGGMIMRMANGTDAGASSFDVRAIYTD